MADIPEDVQNIINQQASTEGGKTDATNIYQIQEKANENALDAAIVDVRFEQPISTNSNITNVSVPIHATTNIPVTVQEQPISSKIVDNYGFKGELTPLYEFRTADTHRLAGGTFVGTTPDTNIYSTTLTGSATSTITDRLMTLATGITANSTGRIETVVTGQYTASNSNFTRFVLSVGDTGVTNNIRRWGATTTQNGFFFYLKGTEFGIGIRKNGSETYISQTLFNGSKTFVLDTNLHIYEIYYKTSGCYFIIDNVLVHTMTVTNVPLIADFNLKPAITNENSNNLATNHTVNCTLMTISRFGNLTTNPFYKNLVGAGTFTLKQSSGRLHSIICNNAANTTGQSITIYDNTSGSGTKIGTLDLSKLPSPMAIQYNSNGVAYSTGLTLVIVGAAVDITVIYE